MKIKAAVDETGIDRHELLALTIQTLMNAAGQAKQQKNPGAVVACIKQPDWMTGLGINSIYGNPDSLESQPPATSANRWFEHG